MTNVAPKSSSEPRRRTQADRTRESTEKLLNAAAALFAVQGYDRTTFAQIAERAGYSSGLVAQRFGSKAALVEALVRDSRKRTEAILVGPVFAERTVAGRISAAIRLYAEAMAGGADRLRALFVLMAESTGPLAEKRELFAEQNRSFAALIEMQIREGARTGEVRADADAPRLALETVAMLRGAALLWIVDPEGIDLRALCEAARRYCLKSLGILDDPIGEVGPAR